MLCVYLYTLVGVRLRLECRNSYIYAQYDFLFQMNRQYSVVNYVKEVFVTYKHIFDDELTLYKKTDMIYGQIFMSAESRFSVIYVERGHLDDVARKIHTENKYDYYVFCWFNPQIWAMGSSERAVHHFCRFRGKMCLKTLLSPPPPCFSFLKLKCM